MNQDAVDALLITLGVNAGVLAALVFGAFLIGLRRGRHDGIDVVWGPGFVVIALITLVSSHGHGDLLVRLLLTGLTVCWGLRLATRLARRSRGGPEERRYAAIRDRAVGGPRLRLLWTVYLPRGLVLWVVSAPVQVGQFFAERSTPSLIAGAVVWLLGFAFETIGGHQLARFRADPANSVRVLDTGLWRYTRHPNHVGDAAVWWGLFLLACHGLPALLTLPAPLLLSLLLSRGSRRQLLERRLLMRRSGYARYVATASGFVPLPPKRERVDR
ncbi:steroid 5-alpha reductase family enzyme [Actinoalloteichus hoggarensis]|uniref:Uncharacterized protein n=1 Tax=Actinoalloteichus hoggarensis TaxID=1470176 RepID=A0A221W8B4_9PSEU|nr:DUF1295 domain-containing protein [Actinoalloteichus hoggarensis]ASO21911.1 hypothetical protein AHOG_21475 [Actinoalloteichus hoggarensis]MBB5924538.1 steroid 5-alpha reductase family enzyme [Actinoalloteichus hoggarensis]